QPAHALDRQHDGRRDQHADEPAAVVRPANRSRDDRLHDAIMLHSRTYMNVLLLRAVPSNERFGLGPFFRIEPLGMEYIAAALEARRHAVNLADLRFSRSLAAQVRASRTDVVGIAAMHALETDEVVALAREVHRLVPEVPIVIGGHTAAAYPEPFLVDHVAAV